MRFGGEVNFDRVTFGRATHLSFQLKFIFSRARNSYRHTCLQKVCSEKIFIWRQQFKFLARILIAEQKTFESVRTH